MRGDRRLTDAFDGIEHRRAVLGADDIAEQPSEIAGIGAVAGIGFAADHFPCLTGVPDTAR